MKSLGRINSPNFFGSLLKYADGGNTTLNSCNTFCVENENINPDANIFEYCAISWNDDQSQNNYSSQDEELMIDLCGIIHSAGNSYTHYVLDYFFLWVMI